MQPEKERNNHLSVVRDCTSTTQRLTESDETVPSGTAPASSGKANGPKRASPPVHTHIVADHMAREPLRASVLAVASFAAAEEQERKQGPAVERAQPPCLLIFVPSS